MQKAQERVDSRAGTLLALFLYNGSPRKFSFVPSAIACHLKLRGVSKDVIEYLNRIGLCLGVKGTSSCLKRCQEQYDSIVLKWKTEMSTIDSSDPSYNLRNSSTSQGKQLFFSHFV